MSMIENELTERASMGKDLSHLDVRKGSSRADHASMLRNSESNLKPNLKPNLN
jgi:hypothetical protein